MGIVNYTYNRSTSGGEIITHLINSTDGQGLSFADGALAQLAYAAGGVFGTGDFSVEFIIDQSSANSNNKILYTSGGSNEFQITSETGSTKIELTFDSTDYDLSYDMSEDYGSPVHYVLTFDRSALATLYKDGNSVATVDISGSSAVNLDSSGTAAGYLGGVLGYGVTGVFYRWRTWKKLLSAAEVVACYENASVPIVDQWTNCVTDLDMAFANPERSLQIQSRSGAGDATASVGIFQITPIEQLNSKSARIGTSAATPADGELLVSGDASIGGSGTGRLSVVSDSDTSGAPSAFDSKYFTVGKAGASGASSGAVFISYNQTDDKGYIGALSPTTAWRDLVVNQSLTIDAAGNVGLSVTPESISSTYPTLQIGYGGQIAANTANASRLSLAANSYLNSGTVRSYIQTDEASEIWMNAGTIALRVAPSGTADAAITWTDALTIDNAGLCSFANGIAVTGAVSATGLVTSTVGNNGTILRAASASTGYQLLVHSSNSLGATYLAQEGSVAGSILTGGTAYATCLTSAVDKPVEIGVNQSLIGKFSSTGLAVTGAVSATTLSTFSAGIAFQSATTGSGTGTGYTLDSYEYGTWTPSLGGDTTYTTQDGQYTKVGRLVNISCNIQVNVLGTGSASTISGLPFTAGSTLNPLANGVVGYFASLAVAPVHIGAYVEQAATTMLIPGTTAVAASASPALSVFGDSARIDITATYFV